MDKLLLAQVNAKVVLPDFINTNALSLGSILGWIIRLVFVGAGLFVFYNLIFGALEWIQSGGDKEKVDKARKRITTAVTGLIILFVSMGAIILVENIFGIGMGFQKEIYIPKFGEV
jgi:hypothetical protein